MYNFDVCKVDHKNLHTFLSVRYNMRHSYLRNDKSDSFTPSVPALTVAVDQLNK